MSDTVSAAALKELFSDSPALTTLYLFEISHPDLASPVYLCNDKVNHTINGIVYQATSFTFTPPDKSQSSITSEGQVTMTVVDQTIPDTLINLREYPTITCTGIMVLATGDIEEVEDWEFSLKEAQWSNLTLTASLAFETYLDTAVPGNTFDSDTCPGCFV